MVTAIAHLSDPHITTGPLSAEPTAGLHRALGRVLALVPRPDLVVVTGDLADHGRLDEYETLRDLLARFPLPVHLVTGNHDDPKAVAAAFGGTEALAGEHDTSYVADRPGLTFVALDSRVPGSPGGRVGEERLAWLDTVLAERPEVPAVVCLHHPPADVGIPYLDGMRLADAEGLAAVVAAHPRVVRVLAGHVHRPVVAPFAGTVLATAPSTYRQSGLCLDGSVPGNVPEPTAFLLHLRTATGWVTHTVAVSHAAAPLGSF